MLQITQIVRYELPRYPRGGDFVFPPSGVGAKARDIAALLALAALFESCGVTDPPNFVTETHARQVIGPVFAGRGIQLASDRTVRVPLVDADTLVLNLDGFNDSLQVGYEYISQEDIDALHYPTRAELRVLDSLNRTASPHVLTVEPVISRAGVEAELRQVVESFLDSLKAQGVI